MTAVGTIVVRAVQVTATFITVLAVGAYYAGHPSPPNQLLDPATLGKLSKLVMGVIAPLLVVVSIGETVTVQMLTREGWVLVVWSFIFLGTCYVISSVVAVVAAVRPAFRDEFVMAATFPNALALPLVMMTTLCRQEPFVGKNFAEEESDTEVTCTEQSLSFLFIYTTGWILTFFATAYPHVLDSDGEAGVSWHHGVRRRLAGVANTNVLSLLVGFGIAMWAPLKNELYTSEGGLLWLSSAAFTLGGPLVGLSSIILGGTLGQSLLRMRAERRRSGGTSPAAGVVPNRTLSLATVSSGGRERTEFVPGPDGRAGLHAESGAGSRAISLPAKADQQHGAAEVAGADLVWNEVEGADAQVERPSWRTQALLVATRMVLCPAVCVVLLMYTLEAMMPPSTHEINAKLVKLILVLEAVVPSADFVVVLCIRGGRVAAAEALAITYLWEYLTGIVTITVGIAVAMAWIGE